MYKAKVLRAYSNSEQERMATAAPVQQKTAPVSSDSVEGLKGLLCDNLAAKSDQDIAILQQAINVAITRLLNALTSPFSAGVEKFLGEMQRVTASNPIPMSECSRNRVFYFGQIYALAELAGTVRHMQVPLEAAGVALNHADAGPILRLVVERDAITKAGLATELGKASQNLHPVLQKLEECGLVRRDEVGRSVVYSPTPLTRVCLNWMQETEAATVE